MKKFIAIMLVFVLALGCCSAFAAGIQAQSDDTPVTVHRYALSITSTDKLILWDDKSGTTAITIVGGSDDNSTDGRRLLNSTIYMKINNGEKKQYISFGGNATEYNITAEEIYTFAKQYCSDETMLVTISTENTWVTKNGISSEVEDQSTEVLIIDKKDDTNLIVATTTVDLTDVYPGDIITVNGKTDISKLETTLDGKGTITVDYTRMYVSYEQGVILDLTNGEGKTNVTATYKVPNLDEGTVITFWTVGHVTVTK